MQPEYCLGDAEEYILGIPRFTSKNSMEDTRSFLDVLGHPEKNLKIIHIAGTNGKGSVCAYLRYILEAAGISTASFLSPHLVSMRERFLIGHQMVSEEDFLWAFEQVKEKVKLLDNGYHPTFFEYLFFMALLIFDRKKVPYAIMETGLGGRLDATNSIDNKEACIVTSIGYDHTEYLGDTLEEIASEKAHIARAGVPLIFLPKTDEVTNKIISVGKQLDSYVFPIENSRIFDVRQGKKCIDFCFDSHYYGYVGVTLHTMALYQVENASLALECIEHLSCKEEVSKQDIVAGLAGAVWEARMEEIGPEVYLDGAHNPDGIRAFLESVRANSAGIDNHLLFSMVKDKRYEEVIGMICDSGLFSHISLTQIGSDRALPVEELFRIFMQNKESGRGTFTLSRCERVAEAFANAKAEAAHSKSRLYIAGSLYLAGEIKEL